MSIFLIGITANMFACIMLCTDIAAASERSIHATQLFIIEWREPAYPMSS